MPPNTPLPAEKRAAPPLDPVLFLSDVVDSTRLTSLLGDARMTELWARHDLLVRAAVAAEGGYEHERTDGFLLRFDRVQAALAVADALHDGLRALSAELGVRVASRVVIHRGAVTVEATAARAGGSGLRLSGPGRALTDALIAICPGGATLLSARSLEGEPEAAGAALEDRGWWRLGASLQPIRLLGSGPPPQEGPGGRRVETPDASAERAPLIGRAAELACILDKLAEGVRLLTLLGPGGIGKTRLAREVGEALRGQGPTIFCALAEARTEGAVLGAVAAALDVPLSGASGGEQIGQALRSRGATLLILDNAEQVVAEVALLVRRWLERCPALRVLVTSRERLGVPGEGVLPLGPLSPEHSLALFEMRAPAALQDEDRANLPRLLEALGGLPLGIELAAAWAGDGALGHLRKQVHFDALAATFETSWGLLAPEDQEAFLRLAVFEGALTLEAAEGVLDWAQDGLERVFSLVDRALLRCQAEDGQTRLDMLVPLREFGRAKISGSPGLEEEAFRLHAAFYAGMGAQAALDALDGQEGGARRSALAAELAQLEIAVERAAARGWAGLVVPLARAVWAARRDLGPVHEGLQTLERARAAAGAPEGEALGLWVDAAEALSALTRYAEAEALLQGALAALPSEGAAAARARLLAALGVCLEARAQSRRAQEPLEIALASWPEAGPPRERLQAESAWLLVLVSLGRGDEALARCERGLARARRDGSRWGEAQLGMRRSLLLDARGDHVEAMRTAVQASALFLSLQDRRGALRADRAVALIAQSTGDVSVAAAQMAGVLRRARALGDLDMAVRILNSVGSTRLGVGDYALARAAFDEALTLARAGADESMTAIILNNLGLVALLEEDLDRCEATLAEARGVLARVESPRHTAVNQLFCARLAMARGQERAALDLLDGLAGALTDPQSQGFMLGLRGLAEVRLGETAPGLAHLGAGVATLRTIGDTLNLAFVLCLLAEAQVLAGLPAEALAEAERLAETLNLPPRAQVGVALAAARAAVRGAP